MYYKKNQICHRISIESKRGSALMAAALCSFVVGLLAVSYLKMATTEYQASVRATLYSSALNLAESGIEMGIADLKDGTVTTATWTGSELAFVQDGPNTGDVYYVITDALSSAPVIYAEGVIRGHPKGDVVKQVRVELSSGFAPFETGLAARNGISFSGNGVTLDSFNSNYGAYNSLLSATTYLGTIPADFGDNGYNRNDDIYIASAEMNVYDTDVTIAQGNADVYGYVSVSPTSTVSIGPNGMVASYDAGTHDPSRVYSDFYADFPTQPVASGLSVGSYLNINTNQTLVGSGSKDSPTQYDVHEISLSGSSQTLTISGHVRIIMGGDIEVTGNGAIRLAANSSLTIYTDEDVRIGGGGVANAGSVATDFMIYGTANTTVDGSGDTVAGQRISIAGNGQLAATIYAPAADVSMSGGGNNGSVMGGVVGFTGRVNGQSSFHFDEALRDIVFGGGGYTIESWMEMTGITTDTTPIDFSGYSF
ncbi:MAG: hypothetical protein ACI81V_000535 [Lentimonas sp.]